MIPYKQLTLAEVFEDCQNKFDNDKYQFLSLLDQTINLDEIVPVSFVTHFHASTGRPRKHPLYPMIKALLIQRIFSIPTDTLLIIFLKYSQELQVFCGFRVVPDASKFTRFKQDFLMDLQSMFDHLVDITEPICQRIDSNLASMSILDTSGIEAWVTENNPKYANRIIKQLKAFAKAHNFDKNFDPYKAAYGSMPAHATANPAIQQMYINGHFCYAYKFGIVTNGLGFEKAFIPLRTKLSMEENGYTFNENGVPCCPHDSTLPMKREGSKSHLRSKLPSMKFVCPKMKWEYNRETKTKRRVCHCENPCTTSSCGRMIYIYPEKNLRAYPGVERGSVEWDETYKIRVNVEKSINHFKDSFCIAGRKTQNEKTLHADLLLAGISQLITVMVTDKIHQHQYIRSLKPLIA
ncbi:transposase [Ruminococcus sp. AF18-22]|uniref:transposase n=2 Tax=Mediterraneibacter TaxID=2316020 RepID=UPI000E4CB6D5|nr:transposase [Ruminococcus sp. AF18-22]